jgi:hypothetical protein
MRWCFVSVSRTTSWITARRSPPPFERLSISSDSVSNESATAVLRKMFGYEMVWLEPTARNSNLLPVKAKGERAVAVARVLRDRRERRHAELHGSRGARERVWPPEIRPSTTSSSSEPRKIERIAGGASFAPRRWSFAGVRDRDAQQVLVHVDGADHGRQAQDEAQVLVRRVARVEQVVAALVGHRPVVVLAAAVDAGEGLLVQEADEPVALGDALHELHRQHVVVGSRSTPARRAAPSRTGAARPRCGAS